MTVQIHRSERADALVRGLAGLLATSPDDPFVPDLVAVPSKGVERWIAQSLSTTLGTTGDAATASAPTCCSRHPAGWSSEAVSVASRLDPDDDPWSRAPAGLGPARRRRPLCAASPGAARWAGTSACVDGGQDRGRRVAIAQKLAALFTAYGAQRPAMLREWVAGSDTDGAGAPLGDDLRWQAELWRRLRDEVGVDSPAERRRRRLPPAAGGPVGRRAARAAVPVRADPADLRPGAGARRAGRAPRRAPVAAAPLGRPVGPGRGGRPDGDPSPRRPDRRPAPAPAARVLRTGRARAAGAAPVPGDATCHRRAPPGDPPRPRTRCWPPCSATCWRTARPPATTSAPPATGRCRCTRCHGRQRQVEVLREVLLGLLDDDPSLEPRDVVVMCPDIESYAPLITAAFGLAVDQDPDGADAVHPGHRLRVRLADRSLRQTNPVLTVVSRLLDLADARLTGSEVLDLAAYPAVRARFGFDDDELERVGDWVRRAGVRWGLDAAGRAPYRLDGVAQNTWRSGLDRLLARRHHGRGGPAHRRAGAAARRRGQQRGRPGRPVRRAGRPARPASSRRCTGHSRSPPGSTRSPAGSTT